jgi:hypothetical protein
MTTPAPNGIFDQELGYILPPDVGTWTTAATWTDFVQWNMLPASPLIWALDIVDLGSVKKFNLKIVTDADGRVEYKIYTSNTGAFAGEETITTVSTGSTGIAAFTGRYVWIEVFVYATGGVNVLYGVEYSISEEVNKFSLNDIDTSTLGGSASARTLVLPKAVSGVTNIQITPKTVSNYQLDVYVTDYPTCSTVIPRILSKTSPYQIALIGLDNIARDAVVDVLVEYLPEGYMSGNNLLVR